MLFICGGLLRTGSVAMWQVMKEIAEFGGWPAPRLGTELDDVLDMWKKKPGLMVTKLHRYEKELDPFIDDIRLILTVRDIRDVVVSLMHFRQDPFETIMHSRAYKNWINEYNRWRNNLLYSRVLEVKYEEFISNRQKTIMDVAHFMGVKLDERSAGHIDNKWSIASNLKRAEEEHPEGSVDYFSRRHIYSRGESRWRKELTEEQIEEVHTPEVVCWLIDHGYEPYTKTWRDRLYG